MLKKKILFVVNSDGFFKSHRLPIALEAQKKGFEVHIATSFSDFKGEFESIGMAVHELHLHRRSMGILSNAQTFLELIFLFRKVRPDIIHLVTIKPVLYGGLAARISAMPNLVVAISGLGFIFTSQGIKSAIRRWIFGILYRLVAGHSNLKVIFQNEDDRLILSKYINLPIYKSVLIRGSGVNLVEYVPKTFPIGEPVIIFAARLLADKGLREFVRAASILRSEGYQARFVIVGGVDNGNPTAISESEIGKWVSENLVEWWGHRSDMSDVLASCNIVVLPSYREGLPKILIEAAACGRPVVTTDVPGCRDAIDPNTTGLLVPVQDAKALAKAISSLIENPQLCQNMGDAGRKLASLSFDINAIVEQHIQVYTDLLGRPN